MVFSCPAVFVSYAIILSEMIFVFCVFLFLYIPREAFLCAICLFFDPLHEIRVPAAVHSQINGLVCFRIAHAQLLRRILLDAFDAVGAADLDLQHIDLLLDRSVLSCQTVDRIFDLARLCRQKYSCESIKYPQKSIQRPSLPAWHASECLYLRSAQAAAAA